MNEIYLEFTKTVSVKAAEATAMNFFDTYELASPGTSSEPRQSLNEEVAEVMGQFGRFWGTFRKQV